MTWIVNATARHRQPILLIGVALAAAYGALVALFLPVGVTLVVLLTVAALLVVLAVVATRRTRPAAFVVRPELAAFTGPMQARPVYFALGILAITGDRIGGIVHDIRADDWLWIDLLSAGFYAFAIVVFVRKAWQGYDVYLRPDGLYNRRGLGTLIVPWDAVPAAHLHQRRSTTTVIPPGAFAADDTRPPGHQPGEVSLSYAQPSLVRRRGWAGNAELISTGHVDAGFLAAAIDFYARSPEHRAAIGTDDGYRRLQEALAEGPRD